MVWTKQMQGTSNSRHNFDRQLQKSDQLMYQLNGINVNQFRLLAGSCRAADSSADSLIDRVN